MRDSLTEHAGHREQGTTLAAIAVNGKNERLGGSRCQGRCAEL